MKTETKTNQELQTQISKIVAALPGKDKAYLNVLGNALYIKDALVTSKELLVEQITAYLTQLPYALQQEWAVEVYKAVEQDLRYSA